MILSGGKKLKFTVASVGTSCDLILFLRDQLTKVSEIVAYMLQKCCLLMHVLVFGGPPRF